MTRATVPASPSDDLTRYRDRGPDGRGPLTPELSAFVQSGISVIVGSRGPDGRPIAGLALACRIDVQGCARILLSRSQNRALLAAIEAGGGIAATFSRPVDHRSIQIKAKRALVAPAHAEDVPEAARQCEGLRKEMIFVGYSPNVSAGYVAHRTEDLAAICFEPELAFVQTPGPGAGGALGGLQR